MAEREEPGESHQRQAARGSLRIDIESVARREHDMLRLHCGEIINEEVGFRHWRSFRRAGVEGCCRV